MCDFECNKACKIDEYLYIKNCFCEKHLSGKLVLEFEDEILNTNETLLNDKKVASAKSNSLFIVFYWQLLVIICVSYYFYYKKCRSKQSFHDMSITLGKVRY